MLKNIRESIHKLKKEHKLINSHVETYYNEDAEDNYLEFFSRIITRLLSSERSRIFINNRETVWIEIGTEDGRKHISVPKEGSMVGRVIASGKAEIINDMEAQEANNLLETGITGLTVYNAICVPVKSMEGKQVTGVIQALNKEDKTSFNADDQKWLEDIAQNIQYNIEHISLHRGSLSITDRIIEASNKLLTITAILFLISVVGFTLFLVALWLAA
jgi:hypothetical protein